MAAPLHGREVAARPGLPEGGFGLLPPPGLSPRGGRRMARQCRRRAGDLQGHAIAFGPDESPGPAAPRPRRRAALPMEIAAAEPQTWPAERKGAGKARQEPEGAHRLAVMAPALLRLRVGEAEPDLDRASIAFDRRHVVGCGGAHERGDILRRAEG